MPTHKITELPDQIGKIHEARLIDIYDNDDAAALAALLHIEKHLMITIGEKPDGSELSIVFQPPTWPNGVAVRVVDLPRLADVLSCGHMEEYLDLIYTNVNSIRAERGEPPLIRPPRPTCDSSDKVH